MDPNDGWLNDEHPPRTESHMFLARGLSDVSESDDGSHLTERGCRNSDEDRRRVAAADNFHPSSGHSSASHARLRGAGTPPPQPQQPPRRSVETRPDPTLGGGATTTPNSSAASSSTTAAAGSAALPRSLSIVTTASSSVAAEEAAAATAVPPRPPRFNAAAAGSRLLRTHVPAVPAVSPSTAAAAGSAASSSDPPPLKRARHRSPSPPPCAYAAAAAPASAPSDHAQETATTPASASCPMCPFALPTAGVLDWQEQLAAHVQTHFADEPPAASPAVAYKLCTVDGCSVIVPVEAWDAHQHSHSLQLAQLLQAEEDALVAGGGAPASDPHGIDASLELARRLQAEEDQSAAAVAAAASSSAASAASAAAASSAFVPTTFRPALVGQPSMASDAALARALAAEWGGDADDPAASGRHCPRPLSDFPSARTFGPDSAARTINIMSPLAAACLRQAHNPTVSNIARHFRLCRDTDHYGQNASDRGWACGYRNIQMMSSHLLQRNEDFAKALFDGKGFVPTVPGVQEYLDRAWARGFDPEGAAQLGYTVQDRRVWIGSTEAAALLRSMGLRAKLVNFFEDGKSEQKHAALIKWVWDYFAPPPSPQRDSPAMLGLMPEEHAVHVSNRPPLYFQHQGHSRTIVGIERSQLRTSPPRYSLLILDPGCPGNTYLEALQDWDRCSWARLFKRGIHTLRMSEYQIMYVEDGLMSPSEQQRSKTNMDGQVLGRPPSQHQLAMLAAAGRVSGRSLDPAACGL